MTERGLSRRVRVALAGVVTGALLAAVGVTVWRVLRPADVSTPAITPYPQSETDTVGPGKRGVFVAAPLIVDDRIRIFAKKREVWADGPPSYHYERSAYWAYRRWPAQLTGVVVAESPRSIVVTSWSDGVLVGIDAKTGKVVWRVEGEVLADEYTGRRTGADTVYNPPGLFTTDTSIITVGAETIRAYSTEGTRLWQIDNPVNAQCRGEEFATSEQIYLLDTCTQTVRRIDTHSGNAQTPLGTSVKSVEPISCATVTSLCRAVRLTSTDGTHTGWLLTESQPIESAPLAQPGALLARDVAIVPNDPKKLTELTGQDPRTGNVIWHWTAPAPSTLLATSGERVIVLVSGRVLATVNGLDGSDMARSGINLLHEPETPYEARITYATNQYVVIERINPDVIEEDSTDDAYYFTHRPVLIAIS